MKSFVLACFVTLASASSDILDAVEDTSMMSLLQHSARPIHKIAEVAQAPPADAVERIRARREARRNNPNFQLTDAQKARRRARRAAKRQAQAAGKAAGQRHFNDDANCDTCLAKCEELSYDVYKQCMIERECRPWQKEDGPSADKCNKRCARAGTWQRTPCNRNCLCDADDLALYEAKAEITSTDYSHWTGGHHRCRDAPIGQKSDCTVVEQFRDSRAHDSIRKCAVAAAEGNADTFNYYNTAKEFGKCDLLNCGSADLKLMQAPPEPESPAGRGNWRVFSTYCEAPPPEEQRFDGETLGNDNN